MYDEFIRGKTFSYAEAVSLESMCPGLPRFVDEIDLTDYTFLSGETTTLTVNSVLEQLCHEPVSVQINGQSIPSWKLYYKTDDSIVLPVCKDGRFFTSEFASRMADW